MMSVMNWLQRCPLYICQRYGACDHNVLPQLLHFDCYSLMNTDQQQLDAGLSCGVADSTTDTAVGQ